MKVIKGGLSNVPGYKFSSIEANIRYDNRLDYTIIIPEKPSNASGVFTTNKIFAAPVKLCRERINNPINAILINSTNANACTGKIGYTNTLKLTSDIAKKLNIPEESVLMSSTGIIGHQLPIAKMIDAHKQLISAQSSKGGSDLAKAIMTTDTFPKEISVSFETNMGMFTIGGTIKGSGMIAPNMATLLSFIITDAPISHKDLKKTFKETIEKSLNSLTIDGDMSTNDTAIILSPISEKYLEEKKDIESFKEALQYVLNQLSDLLITDGEGATKKVTVKVKGAINNDEAKKIAKSVSESLLVKTAFFGEDPNWGRIIVAAGYSGAEIKEESLSIFFGDIPLLQNGNPIDFDEDRLKAFLSNKDFTITIDIGIADGNAKMLTSDLSYDYIKINAEYST